ncbi:Lipoprotein signal peptidase [bioreactor metagenome]|uniref:Lipoprotein signal peptidase n=1 Tax=bioreactor metagenome TaxID=1076179 RepID=A0A644YJ26_9ZZZZ
MNVPATTFRKMYVWNRNKMKKLLQIFIPFMIALLLDGLTKAWAEQAISSPILILGNFFRFTLGYNTGVAFGLLRTVGYSR